MNKILCFKLIFLSCCKIIISQEPDGFPYLEKGDLPGAKIISSRTYNGPSLFGYINGGAELYLEYGFEFVSTSEIEYMGGRYKTEIFRMANPEAAFGIYSVSKSRCLSSPDISDFTCQNKYQLQICKGSYYINIINRSGSAADSSISIRIGRIIAGKIEDKKINFLSFIPDTGDMNPKNNLIFVKGKLGIINGSPELEDCFNGLKDYSALIVKGTGRKTLSVRFESTESLKRFLEMNNIREVSEPPVKNDTNVCARIRSISDNHVVLDFK